MIYSDIKFIDIKDSKWDKEKSDPAKGQYAFTEKKFIGEKAYAKKYRYKFYWAQNDERGWGIADAQNKWPGCVFVLPSDPVIPVIPATYGGKNAEGHFVFKDIVLVKIPIDEYIAKRREEIALSEEAPANIKRQLKNLYETEGVSLTDDEIERMLK